MTRYHAAPAVSGSNVVNDATGAGQGGEQPWVRPSVETLRRLLRYDAETGNIYWLERGPEHFSNEGWAGKEVESIRWNTRWAGKLAFRVFDKCGYFRGGLLGRQYYAHVVAFALHYGKWPEKHIDHINRDKRDNRALNLREATTAQNSRNCKRNTLNTSGVKGVAWDREHRRWRVRISTDAGRIHVGRYKSIEDARRAYQAAALKHHGDFARLA